ncbi:outer mitochondrial membrane transport complex protein-domain-containing protein, partial [Lasiosphaeria miniovina]
MLQLHVWGPAFGLPSIDAECLAAIAYLTQTTSRAEFRLVQTSPSAVPTHHLPALHDPSTDTWASGFAPITSHLRAHPPPSFNDASPPRHADSTAYAAFLTAHAAPLVALSLYVSSANWAATTRPAYSAILPFPLPWTEPPTVRAAMGRRAKHLGMSSLDTDAETSAAESGQGREDIPGGAGGWVHMPAALRRAPRSVRDALAPEQAARIRLGGLAKDVLDVLAEVDWEAGEPRTTAAARCLAFAYLALMLVPDVPRPWLRDTMRAAYPRLCEFVETFRWECFPDGGGEVLPWGDGKASNDSNSGSGSGGGSSRSGGGFLEVGARFAQGLIFDIPGIGEEWHRWLARRKRRAVRQSGDERQIQLSKGSDALVVTASAGLALLAANIGVFLYRAGGMPSFGAPLHSWHVPMAGLSGLGAAGALFSG